jgi:hypothetical protein
MIGVMAFANLPADTTAYAQGKKWYWYLPLWLLGVYLFVGLLGYNPNKQMPFLISIAQAFDFFLHEMAHIITGFLPAILTAAAGSFSELLLGTALVVVAFKQRSYFAATICMLWLMMACQSVGIYMADARPQRLSLVSLGGELSGSDTVIHDWNFVFTKLHMLGFSGFIGTSVRVVGVVIGLCALVFGAYLLYKMAAAPAQNSQNV